MAIPKCGKDVWSPEYQEYLVEKHALVNQHRKGNVDIKCLDPKYVLGDEEKFNLNEGSY